MNTTIGKRLVVENEHGAQGAPSIAKLPDGAIGAGFGKHAAPTRLQPPAKAAQKHFPWLTPPSSTHSSESYVRPSADLRFEWPTSSKLSDLMLNRRIAVL